MDSDSILKAVLNKLGKKYEYGDSVGEGAYSKVYLANHTILKKDRAIKIMDSSFLLQKLKKEDPGSSIQKFQEIKERFVGEARLYAKIDHPNIVKIYDIDVIENEREGVEIPYIIMDYIKGSSLKNVIKDEAPLEFRKAIRISKNILSALSTIHKKKIIHRDIKPANIMITEEGGDAILIDFGLAKDKLNETTLTKSEARLGTPQYMSCEQFKKSKELDHKTDIYSFGVVLFEMLVGEAPFKGDDFLKIMDGHCEKPIPNVKEKNPDLPAGIEEILYKALAKDPNHRYETAKEFWDALNKLEKSQEIAINKNEKGLDVEKTDEIISEEKKTREVELRQEDKVKIKTEEKEKIAEAKIESEKRTTVKEKKKKIEIGKREGEVKEKIKKEKKSRKKLIKYIIMFIFGIIAVAAFILLKSSIPGWRYDGYISSAKTFIESNDWEKAGNALEKAKKIKDTPEIERLFAEIKGKRTEVMKRDWDDLKAFLKGKSSNKDKLEKCREFLAKHEGIPGNGEKTTIFSEVNLSISKLDAAVRLDEEYKKLLNAAKEDIKKGDYPKAVDSLEKAKKNRGRFTDEIAALYKEIEEKQLAAMRDDFEILKKFLAGGATAEEKLGKCREFLGKHQNTPGNKKAMVDETNRFISNLNAEIKAIEQYQKYVDAVNNLINSEDYEKAEKELNKARKIKDSEDVKRLSVTITQGIEKERKNGEKEYKAIKDKLTLSQYQAFQGNYHNSVHLPDLRDRLKTADKNLPPDKYWDKPIRENEKGYYEFTFGNEHNGHLMIYIPEKGIWIDKYEVSWAQFKNFLKAAKIQFPPIPEDKIIGSGGEYPAVVTYEDAQNYCQSYGLRLPSVAEWEYSGGKGKFIYPWGNENPDESGIWRANYDSLEGVVEKDGFEGTAAVKSFEKFSSPFGVVNMAGNVWEWIQGNILKGGGFFSKKENLKIKSFKPGNSEKEGFRCIKIEK